MLVGGSGGGNDAVLTERGQTVSGETRGRREGIEDKCARCCNKGPASCKSWAGEAEERKCKRGADYKK